MRGRRKVFPESTEDGGFIGRRRQPSFMATVNNSCGQKSECVKLGDFAKMHKID